MQHLPKKMGRGCLPLCCITYSCNNTLNMGTLIVEIWKYNSFPFLVVMQLHFQNSWGSPSHFGVFLQQGKDSATIRLSSVIFQAFSCYWAHHCITLFLNICERTFFQHDDGLLHLDLSLFGLYIESFRQTASKWQFNTWNQLQTLYLFFLSLSNKGTVPTWPWKWLSINCPNTFETP